LIDTGRFGREVGSRLRQARKSRGWSLADVEELSGGRWSKEALGTYERADRQMLVEYAGGLAEFYGLDLRTLLAEAERATLGTDAKAA
jgi:transcriptional regulator with XRE-family HTH domain